MLAEPENLAGRIAIKSLPIFGIVSTLLFALLAGQLLFHIVRASVTIDEPPHILAGYRHLQCGDFGINPEHPPLLKMLAAAPLMFRELAQPPWECGSKLTTKFESFTYGSSFLVDNGVDSVLMSARIAAALMTLVLAVLVFLAALEMFGRWEAVTALAILAFEPSLIGHGSIVTTDMAITATTFGAVYALYRFGRSPGLARFAVAGLAMGLLLAAKHSAVIFIPVLFILVIADGLLFRSKGINEVGRRGLAFAGMFLIGWLMLWAFYGFRYYSIPSATSETVSIADYIRENARPEMAQSLTARTTAAIGQTGAFPESYVLGMADVISWGSRNTLIFGTNYPTGQWFYFPVAFVVKSSLALLLLFPAGILLPFIRTEKRREALFLLLPPAAFFGVAMMSSFTTGVRHILPIYPFLIVASAGAAIWLVRTFRWLRFVVVGVLVLSGVSVARMSPKYLVFANDLWGGSDNTRRIFSDSNVETGQSIKLVNDYIERENIKECWIAAFVHPEIIESIQPCRVLPSALRILVTRHVREPVPEVIEGTIFVSVAELPPRGAGEYVPIGESEPIELIGGNVLVFRGRFEVPLAAAISHVYRSGALLRLNMVEQALEDARRAVQLGPADPRTHLALGLALNRSGERDAARREFEWAVSLAENQPVFRNAEVRAQLELAKLK